VSCDVGAAIRVESKELRAQFAQIHPHPPALVQNEHVAACRFGCHHHHPDICTRLTPVMFSRATSIAEKGRYSVSASFAKQL
jgi:hypothetical protein